MCIVGGCAKPVKYNRMCGMHAERVRRNGTTIPKVIRDDVVARFWSKVQITPGCWLWISKMSPGGYGMFPVNRRTVMAHRYAYELLVGPIPDGLQIDHLCRVRACVNPNHLEPVTCRENTMRSPIARASINAQKQRCARGHDPDWRVRADGSRACRSCEALRQGWYRTREFVA